MIADILAEEFLSFNDLISGYTAIISSSLAAPWRCVKLQDGSTVCYGNIGKPTISPPSICVRRPSPPCSSPATIFTPPQPCQPPPCPQPYQQPCPPPCPQPYPQPCPPPCPQPSPPPCSSPCQPPCLLPPVEPQPCPCSPAPEPCPYAPEPCPYAPEPCPYGPQPCPLLISSY
ncbi:unnamed protein product [Euphydryas editha]|uniref:Uncharacterized protein n=1 Tax=Euphydryas editha TaxID=104508 RepID=A0AAU9T957_EUPED|nr:unnamed protein product [Euphydryas editha]